MTRTDYVIAAIVMVAAVAQRFDELYPNTQTSTRSSRASGARAAGYNTGTSLGRGTSIAS